MEAIAQVVVIVSLISAIGGLYTKIRASENENKKTMDKKIEQKFNQYKEVQVEKDKAMEEKFRQLWHKINSLDTEVSGSSVHRVKGLVMTVAELRLAIKEITKGG